MNNQLKKTVSIIGFGRFGQLLWDILKNEFDIKVYDEHAKKLSIKFPNIKIASSLEEVFESEIIFYVVPIIEFENAVKLHKKYYKSNHLLIDVLSVKIFPKKVWTRELIGLKTQAILTHPMFGPDSVRIKGLEGQPLIIDRFKSDDKNYKFWVDYFRNKNLDVIEMTPEDHDKNAARSQGVTHFVGRVLKEYNLKPTPIDSLGSKKLNEVVDQTCNDTWALFFGLQNYNPYTKKMRLEIGEAYDNIYNKLIPNQVTSEYITFGIQGGKGSFNEQAIYEYINNNHIQNYKIKYLYTSENVMSALHKGEIDFGQFAIHNAIGGMVQESIKAIAKYKFEIIEEFAILISHHLMKLKNVKTDEIKTIMAHDQVLKQCKETLTQKYSNFELKTGEGNLADTATAAKALYDGKISGNTAILGPKILADIYNFDIIDSNLQDMKENYTSFLVVKRIKS